MSQIKQRNIFQLKVGEKIPENFTGIAINENQSKFYYRDGLLHREDGPAREWATGHKEWWIDGEEYTWLCVFTMIKDGIYIKTEKDDYNLYWLTFLTEEGFEKFPIIPGMETDPWFKASVEMLKQAKIIEATSP